MELTKCKSKTLQKNLATIFQKTFWECFKLMKKNRFNDISIEVKNKEAKYPFMIANTDPADKGN